MKAFLVKNTDTAEEVKGDFFKVRVHEFVYNLLQQILFAVLPMRTEIGYNTILRKSFKNWK